MPRTILIEQVEQGEIDRDGANALIASKLAERAVQVVVKTSIEAIKTRNESEEN